MNRIVDKTNKSSIIDIKVDKYIEMQKSIFYTNININTKIVNKNDIPINYKNEKQTFLYKRAKELFSNIGKKEFNNNTETIYVNNTDIKESIEKTIKNPVQKKLIKENLAVFSQLDKIIENGIELSFSKLDNKNRLLYCNYKYYASKALIDNKPYIIEFDTRLENKNNKKERHFRLERVYPIEKDDSATGANKKFPNRFGTEPSHVNNIHHLIKKSKSNDLNENKSIK